MSETKMPEGWKKLDYEYRTMTKMEANPDEIVFVLNLMKEMAELLEKLENLDEYFYDENGAGEMSFCTDVMVYDVSKVLKKFKEWK